MKTALYDRHCQLGAKIAAFAGWEMPIQYKGIIAEHQAVRQSVGLFDVSHMGRISIHGPDAEMLLDKLSTNHISGRPPFSATYTVWCHPDGGSVDDLMVYRFDSSDRFFVVANAGNRQKDLEHLMQASEGLNVQIQDHFTGCGILALQGPKADLLLSEFYPSALDLKPMHLMPIQEGAHELIISRTGYTGAGGFELFAPDELILSLWDSFLRKGQAHGIEPVGLGARDTLRLEMGFALYGHELTDEIAPTESVSAWTVKWDKDFIGKEALERLEKSGEKRMAYAVKLIDKGIARQGFAVLKEGHEIGQVTSGSYSPTLNAAISLILVKSPLQIDEMVDIQIRQSLCKAQVIQLPFVRKNR